ncbi:MAG TPA: DUF4142 domain-containing protein [Bryobacteraceae bacterium]|nr:DUF4142 domain-containing protein [Bryobacteraceae bacterium]
MLRRTLIVVLCCAGVPMFGQKAANTTNASSHETMADTTFMHKAAQGGMAEVKLGQLAEQKASNQAVKDFGKRMATDHQKANDQLKSIASNKNVTLPDSMDAKDQALYDRLSKLSGPEFDREYMRAMVRDHRMDVNEFRRESERAKDQDVRSFASSTLPVLQQHLQLAEQTSSQVGATAKK